MKEVEIKVLRCRGLTAFNFFQKLTLYCSVSIISNNDQITLTPEQKQEQKTEVDQEGDGDPEWNHPMKFDLNSIPNTSDLSHFSLLFEFRHHTQFFPDRNIGEVRVPLKDLIDSVGVGAVRFPSYQVTSPDGKHNGVLDFSYKVIGGSGNSSNFDSDSRVHVTGYVVHHQHQRSDSLLSDPEKIEYPKIGFDELSGNVNVAPSGPPLVGGGDENGKFQFYPYPPPPKHETEHFQYYSPPPTSVAMGHYPPSSPANAHPPAHYLSPFSQLVVYPPPPTPPQQPYGEPYWGYHGPAPPHHQHSGHGYEHHHWGSLGFGSMMPTLLE